MEIIPIFANPIFSLDIPIPEGLPQYCLGMEKGKSRSNIGGWQTDKKIHHNSQLFQSYLNQNFFMPLIKALRVAYTGTLDLNSSWLNICTKGAENVKHMHSSSDISFIWYIQVPEDCGGKLSFYNPHQYQNDAAMRALNKEYVDKLNYYHIYDIIPYDGLCIVFPSYLEHSVGKITKDCDRISYSGNFKFHINDTITRFPL